MTEPAKLFLVRPEDQPAPDANVQAIAKYLVWFLFWLHVQKHYSTKLFKLNLPDLIEIWYWFDEKSCTHRIIFLGDNLPFPEATGIENYDPYTDHAYYWFPLVLYHAFSDFHLPYPLPTLEVFAAQFNIGPKRRIPRWIEETWKRFQADPAPDRSLNRYSDRFWSEPVRHLLADPLAVADNTRELAPHVLSEMDSLSKRSRKSSSAGDSWEATLMLLDYVNRIPAVRVPLAARILQVTEKTVYNQCGKNLECIPHRGTTWVTKRSIQSWVNELYRPTVKFNLWDNVVAEIEKHPAADMIMPQNRKDVSIAETEQKNM
jgi:hypothetical protein